MADMMWGRIAMKGDSVDSNCLDDILDPEAEMASLMRPPQPDGVSAI